MKLELDPTRCTAHGSCAELLPGVVSLDEWGTRFSLGSHPKFVDVPPAGLPLAKQAVAHCPRRALRIANS